MFLNAHSLLDTWVGATGSTEILELSVKGSGAYLESGAHAAVAQESF